MPLLEPTMFITSAGINLASVDNLSSLHTQLLALTFTAILKIIVQTEIPASKSTILELITANL